MNSSDEKIKVPIKILNTKRVGLKPAPVRQGDQSSLFMVEETSPFQTEVKQTKILANPFKVTEEVKLKKVQTNPFQAAEEVKPKKRIELKGASKRVPLVPSEFQIPEKPNASPFNVEEIQIEASAKEVASPFQVEEISKGVEKITFITPQKDDSADTAKNRASLTPTDCKPTQAVTPADKRVPQQQTKSSKKKKVKRVPLLTISNSAQPNKVPKSPVEGRSFDPAWETSATKRAPLVTSQAKETPKISPFQEEEMAVKPAPWGRYNSDNSRLDLLIAQDGKESMISPVLQVEKVEVPPSPFKVIEEEQNKEVTRVGLQSVNVKKNEQNYIFMVEEVTNTSSFQVIKEEAIKSTTKRVPLLTPKKSFTESLNISKGADEAIVKKTSVDVKNRHVDVKEMSESLSIVYCLAEVGSF